MTRASTAPGDTSTKLRGVPVGSWTTVEFSSAGALLYWWTISVYHRPAVSVTAAVSYRPRLVSSKALRMTVGVVIAILGACADVAHERGQAELDCPRRVGTQVERVVEGIDADLSLMRRLHPTECPHLVEDLLGSCIALPGYNRVVRSQRAECEGVGLDHLPYESPLRGVQTNVCLKRREASKCSFQRCP